MGTDDRAPGLVPGASSFLGLSGTRRPRCPLLCDLRPCTRCGEEIAPRPWVHAHADEEAALPPLWWHSRCWAAEPTIDPDLERNPG